MLDFLIDIDTQILLFFNGLHCPFFDYFMKAFSGKLIWVPMYATMLYILFRRFGWKVALCFTIGIACAIALADQIGASMIRPAVERYRPSNLNNPIHTLVHIVDGYRGGRYGFPSCHAANSFALATFLSLLFTKRRFTIFIFIWAITTAYSRLYLGVHYPGDLLVGALLGSASGWLTYSISKKIAKEIASPSDYDSSRFYDSLKVGNATFSYQLSDITIGAGLITALSIAIYSTFACW